ncbi:MAG: DUF951 domain-containing protein [Lachnospiraceae bacterium]|nr:DUF951 domain-containing protein [Lachnospiraceae bacterium]
MDIRLNDVCRLKKEHPCGSKEWLVLRVGADFRLQCTGCSHQLMLSREKLEKNLRRIIRNGVEMQEIYKDPQATLPEGDTIQQKEAGNELR